MFYKREIEDLYLLGGEFDLDTNVKESLFNNVLNEYIIPNDFLYINHVTSVYKLFHKFRDQINELFHILQIKNTFYASQYYQKI